VKLVGVWKLLVVIVPLVARQWPRVVEARAGANFAGDRDREHAAATLREQYARGYLTFDELARRVGRVVNARSRRDLRRALSGLSVSPFDPPARPGPAELFGQARRVLLLVLTGGYLIFTFTLLLVIGLVALIQGLSASELAVFLIIWLVPTLLLSRSWRRQAR
jgi:hypothetical protein